MLKILALLISVSSLQAFGSESDKWNFRFHPIALFYQVGAMDLDYKICDHMTVGAELSQTDSKISARWAGTNKDIKTEALGMAINTTLFMKGAFKSGLYVTPSLKYMSIKNKMADSANLDQTGSGDIWYVTGIVGYGWFWETFNIMLGLGGSQPFGDNKVHIKDSLTGQQTDTVMIRSGFAGEFTLGWSF